MGWQWHQLDHMQIICTLLQTNSHASTSRLSTHKIVSKSCKIQNTNTVKKYLDDENTRQDKTLSGILKIKILSYDSNLRSSYHDTILKLRLIISDSIGLLLVIVIIICFHTLRQWFQCGVIGIFIDLGLFLVGYSQLMNGNHKWMVTVKYRS